MPMESFVASCISILVLFVCAQHGSVFGDQFNKGQLIPFSPLKCSGAPVCVMSKPVKSFNVQSQGQCVLECKRQTCEHCVGVNFREQHSTCDMFSNVTSMSEFSKNETGCQYIQKGRVDNLDCEFIFDIDECNTNNGGCDANATCNNTRGSFTCECNRGFYGNGFICNDNSLCRTGTRPLEMMGEGQFSSPNYPQNYPAKANCHWRITSSSEIVTLRFDSFSTERSYDIVTIYDGGNTTAPVMAQLSDVVSPNQLYQTTQSVMFVRFTSDYSGSRSGFSATFSSALHTTIIQISPMVLKPTS